MKIKKWIIVVFVFNSCSKQEEDTHKRPMEYYGCRWPKSACKMKKISVTLKGVASTSLSDAY